MTGKITAALVAAIVLASAGVAPAQTEKHSASVASAQTNRHSARASNQVRWQAPYFDSYYNKDYWDAVGVREEQRDPYVGTVFEGVAPY